MNITGVMRKLRSAQSRVLNGRNEVSTDYKATTRLFFFASCEKNRKELSKELN